MKILLTSLAILLAASSCSIDPNAFQKKEDLATQTTPEVVVPKDLNPNKDICNYSKDPDKGCLKAVIANSNLYVGEMVYAMGAMDFIKKFPQDLVLNNHIALKDKEQLKFTYTISPNSFYERFFIAAEGTHTSYPAYNTGLGNLYINSMSPGSYGILIYKEFDMKIVDKDNSVVQYMCVSISTNQQVEVMSGKETGMSHSINTFEIDIEETSCNGISVKTKVNQVDTTKVDKDTKTAISNITTQVPVVTTNTEVDNGSTATATTSSTDLSTTSSK